ncbi:MAG TPA: DUF3581 family protein [Porticoccaceae bacterium]|nr:DUF3581 family protein [Porticoccaceae bacterium]HIK79694.1 DUF3581 family protein [Porticoccaceae bacterium]
MFIDDFYHKRDSGITISGQQASDFAKIVCNDFNPIHDAGSKRFCVPGDLLFALAINHYGLREKMDFRFSGLLAADTPLIFPPDSIANYQILDVRGKSYLEGVHSGNSVQQTTSVDALVKAYVRFSGHNFPHILVPLMADNNVMINPQRPLIIYQSMSLELDYLKFKNPRLQIAKTSLTVDGKRGDGELYFTFHDDDKIIGRGVKKLILSGLRPYQQEAVDGMVAEYQNRLLSHT